MPKACEHLLSLLASSIDAIVGGLVIVDLEGRLVLWSGWLQQRSGLSQAEVLGRTLDDIFPELRGSRLLMAVSSALKQGQASLLSHSLNRAPFPLYPDPAHTKDQGRIQQMIQVIPIVVTDQSRHCLIQISDVSLAVSREALLRQQAGELRNYAYLDGLTKIPNRRRLDEYLDSELKRAIRASHPISVILIDIDYFKLYNDTYGHQMGDSCLIQVAATLKGCIKRPGDLVARYGGEEFTVALVDTDLPGALQMANRMRSAVQALHIEHTTSRAAPHITISLGVVSVVPSTACEVSMLIAAADVALYQAKQDGRNRLIPFEPKLHCALCPGEIAAGMREQP